MTIDLSIASAFSEQDQQLAAIRAEQPRTVAAKIAIGNLMNECHTNAKNTVNCG